MMTDRGAVSDIERLAGWVAAYDAQGWHRTGSRTDRRSADWLVGAARDCGAVVSLESFAFSRMVHRHSSLRVDGTAFAGIPLFDAPLPPTGGVHGALGLVGSGADIGVVEAAPGPGLDDPLGAARRSGAHRAIVVLARGGAPGLALRNAPSSEPYGPPVLQVSSRHGRAVLQAATRRAVGTVEVDAHRAPGRAWNVVAGPTTAPAGQPAVVVLTPRSGWWQCAAERGGGLACWLDALRAATRVPTSRSVRFVATSGHELGHLGLGASFAARPADLGATWVHLGANLGARGGLLGVAASDEGLARRAIEALEGAGVTRGSVHQMELPVGEASELRRAGARFVSFVGTNAHFHLATDRYPQNVDLAYLGAATSAISSLVRDLAEQP